MVVSEYFLSKALKTIIKVFQGHQPHTCLCHAPSMLDDFLRLDGNQILIKGAELLNQDILKMLKSSQPEILRILKE